MDATGSRRLGCVIWFGQPEAQECSGLTEAGWNVRVAGGDVCVKVREGGGMVALADLRQGDAQLLQAMQQLMTDCPSVPWIALIPLDMPARRPQVKRILQGCRDFFSAPLDLPRLLVALEQAAGIASRGAEVATDLPELVGRSASVAAVVASLRKYAPIDLPVLITGETGVGKEVAARVLHRLSIRAMQPFVAINCGALPPNLVQSELFGHERGAFTGATARRIGHIESAAGGTILLDEVGDLPLDAQINLLRFLQEGVLQRVGNSRSVEVDVRVMAATHLDLEHAVAAGRFREDLYYRLNVLRLQIPPLRERGDDVDLLAHRFLERFRARQVCAASGFESVALRAMHRYPWPGNVRELRNRVQRAAVMAEGPLISATDLALPGDTEERDLPAVTSLGVFRASAEREVIAACLRECRFNISECARRLQVSRVTMYRLCKKYQLELRAP
ncbi:sigma-54-dependent Fis family transcriptional regulator [Rhodanobacter sp. 7MK24]|uniref:sigma-54 dependent transcriptional regulator n=1 Tax=Rhodanobacter sp. 7MK24 TaxID=2775922 RepID=UPI001785C870|nr:sigma-54 dependent transcriptional regulator [Rhodanobacter sp. 7MK24]MBD8881228.1 sigma-54-dependent Fis family transcriptional regulator [Rhodanobacter sp. 7MK24]